MKRILAVILALALLLGAVPVFAEVDYAADYEAALTLAHNDLTNVTNVREAIDILRRLGSYMLSRGYVQYLSAIADLAGENPDLDKDILSVSILSEAPALVTDLAERGFPSCEELLQYMEARLLERGGDAAGAYDLYKTMMIMDAPDRAIGLRMSINSSNSLVTVIWKSEDGTELDKRTEVIPKGGEKTFTAREFAGYAPASGSEESVLVTVDTLGRQSHKEVVFVYRKLPDSATVQIVYKTDGGMTLGTDSVTVDRGTTKAIVAKTFDGYDLTSYSSAIVTVNAEGVPDKSQVVFTYHALPDSVEVTVICRDEYGTQLSQSKLSVDRGTTKTVTAEQIKGYELSSASSARVTVDARGVADPAQVVFTYRQNKPRFTVGEYVTFGRYPQTKEGYDSTPIEWLVLDVQGDRALLISKYILDNMVFSTEANKDIANWENSQIRQWLNSDFLRTAFDSKEESAIVQAIIDNSYTSSYANYTGTNDTLDRVFLLSEAEAIRYFGASYRDTKQTKPRTSPTAYAIQRGAGTYAYRTDEGKYAGQWWLRLPVYYNGSSILALYSSADGSLHFNFVRDVLGVRPAIWIDMNADAF